MTHRMNIYGIPHKGLRLGLTDLSQRLGRIDSTNHPEWEETRLQAAEIANLLHLHLHSEEAVVLPAIEAKAPGSTAENHEEHERLEVQENEVFQAIAQLSAQDLPDAFSRVYADFNTFLAAYFEHMAGEETQMNATIWRHFSDEEIASWHGQIMGTLKPEEILSFFKYMIPAMTAQEQSMVLGGFKQNAPADFYSQVIGLLKTRTTKHQFANIAQI